MAQISLSPKQLLAWRLLNDPRVVELLYGGAAGGGKSLLVTLWMAIQCRMFPGVRIGLGRKEISNLRKTTVQTMLAETHPILGVRDKDFRYSAHVDPGIYYRNGSEILFTDLAPAPSDPNFDRLGSLNLTHTVIEEAGEIVKQARSVFTSRKNRYKNKEYGITGKTILTCNPSENFTRDEFYEPYLAAGGGDMQTWEHGLVEVEGQMMSALKGFIKALPTDNPFLSRNYIETLNNLPETERRRLKEGDWDYNDDEGKLFKTHLFKRSGPAVADAEVYAGCDPSRGGDNCTFGLIKGDVVTDLEELAIPKTPGLDIGTYVAEHFVAFCKRHGAGYDHAAVDVVGIGASVYDACNRLEFYVRAFNAGSPKGVRLLNRFGAIVERPGRKDEGVLLFNNIRSQNLYDIAQAAHTGALTFLEGLPLYDKFKRDCAAHLYEVKERQTVVESKDKMQARLGRSPDYLDCIQAAWWCRESGVKEPTIRFLTA